jgi:hypothetical protein
VKDNLPDHHRRPTSVGEIPGSDLAIIFAMLALACTSVAASYVLARMADGSFSGLNVLLGWAPWTYRTINVYGGYYWPFCKTVHLTAYGVSILHAIEITWAIGATVSLAIFVVVNRLLSPRSSQDPREIKDSARMANETDYRKAGFLPD